MKELKESDLDGTTSHHLLPKMVLVLPDGTIPFPDGPVLAHKNILGNFIEQSISTQGY